MPERPLASVIICTRNRAKSLQRTLESIQRASRNVHSSWELLVVDNGSSDNTPEVISAFYSVLPIKRVEQQIPGLSNARNAGVRLSKGEFIIWTDDDVEVDLDWLAAYLRVFEKSTEDVIFGGRAVPRYEAPEENWFVANEDVLRSLLAIRDEPSWTMVTGAQAPYGLNYAIRGNVQRRHLYDPNLGVAPGRRLGGEETAVINAILKSGGTGAWVWDATVYHLIPSERQTEQYIRQYYRADGYLYPVCGSAKGLLSTIKKVLRSLAKWTFAETAFAVRKRTDYSSAVPSLVASVRAKASLRRYIGLSVD